MNKDLPGIIVTGASGFIGKNFIEASARDFRLFCLARRSQNESGIPKHENIRWSQVDVSDFSNLQEVVQSINKYGGADYVVHLAGYYDFTMKDHPAYRLTNVTGTRNVLKLAQYLNIKRFIFASSLAACKFTSDASKILHEQSPPDASYPYAKSKRLAEELILDYSGMFPCTILRLAAVFSDWCEYPPLFAFLNTWLSNKWNSRILGGRGTTSITYIHISDLVKLIHIIIAKTETLPQINTFNASPSGTISHNDLFKAATRYYFGRSRKSIKIPKIIAMPGVIFRTALGSLIGNIPFERPWMIRYIDRKLVVNASHTENTLDWKISGRNDIIRRLLFMIENMKNHYVDWTVKNETQMIRTTSRFNLKAYEVMLRNRDLIINRMLDFVLHEENAERFANYRKMENMVVKWYITMLYQLISTSIKVGDRILIRRYIQTIAYRRYKTGFPVNEVVDFLCQFERIIKKELLIDPETSKTKDHLFNAISIAIQLSIDEMEESFETFEMQPPDMTPLTEKGPSLQNVGNLKQIISGLEDTFFDSIETDLMADFRAVIGESVNRES
jgi:nucleoside-diphosphate-sugar epimerase